MSETNSRLRYRLDLLSAEQRDQLMASLEVSKTTYYRLRDNPHQLTLEQAERLRVFLEGLDNCEYDMFRLLEPVEL